MVIVPGGEPARGAGNEDRPDQKTAPATIPTHVRARRSLLDSVTSGAEPMPDSGVSLIVR